MECHNSEKDVGFAPDILFIWGYKGENSIKKYQNILLKLLVILLWYEELQYKPNELVRNAPEKIEGKRFQKVGIVFNFVGEIHFPTEPQTEQKEASKQEKTA